MLYFKLDAYHVMKLIRNFLFDYHTFCDGEGQVRKMQIIFVL